MRVPDHRRRFAGDHADGAACFAALAHNHSASGCRRMIDIKSMRFALMHLIEWFLSIKLCLAMGSVDIYSTNSF